MFLISSTLVYFIISHGLFRDFPTEQIALTVVISSQLNITSDLLKLVLHQIK